MMICFMLYKMRDLKSHFEFWQSCNRTDSVSRYCVLIKTLNTRTHDLISLSHHKLISQNDSRNYQMLHLKFNSQIQQWMFYSNSIIKFNYQKCSQIQLHVQFLLHAMYKNQSHFFNKNFLSCIISCILQKHHNLTFNKIIFFSSKLS